MANEDNEEHQFEVPLPGGDSASIRQLAATQAEETLGVLSCPTGDQTAVIARMQKKADEWIGRAKDSHLGRRDIWFLLERQLWMGLRYGLCCNSSPWKKLETALKKQWHQLIPMGGVIRSSPLLLRQLDPGFFGIGCPHVGVECFVEQTAKLLMHCGYPSSIGHGYKVSLEYVILELGMSFQPLQLSYQMYSKRLTNCWLKSLWEKCYKFNVQIVFNFLDEFWKLPRRGDKWIMAELERIGCNTDVLERLNRVRTYMQVLFLSDVLGASGKT